MEMHTTFVPPMRDAEGDLVRDRYLVKLNGTEIRQASEWGTIGHIINLMREIGDDGRGRIAVDVHVSRIDGDDGAEIGAPGGSKTARDADAQRILNQLAALLTAAPYC